MDAERDGRLDWRGAIGNRMNLIEPNERLILLLSQQEGYLDQPHGSLRRMVQKMAVHEAGHTVAFGRRYGKALIQSVSIEANAPGLKATFPTRSFDGSQQSLHTLAVTHYAGVAAEVVCADLLQVGIEDPIQLGRLPSTGDGDAKRLERIARENKFEVRCPADRLCYPAWRSAVRQIELEKCTVVRIANALLWGGRMDKARVEAVVGEPS